MARIDWVEHRLKIWSQYKEQEGRGGLGYATQSVLLAERLDRHRESNIMRTIDVAEVEETNRAVESLKVPYQAIYHTLQMKYIARPALGHRDIARMTGNVGEGRVVQRLDQADQLLREWFNRARADKAARSQALTAAVRRAAA